MKSLDIPQDVPVGLVIGKKGAVCKSMQAEYGVQMRVDSSNRCVHLSGQRHNVAQAEQQLIQMFENFTLKGSTTYSHSKIFITALKGAESSNWKFVTRKVTQDEIALNNCLPGMDYVLLAVDFDGNDSESVAVTPRKRWVSNLDQVTGFC
jgi:polyribonucleotide nucleotidyltransferase